MSRVARWSLIGAAGLGLVTATAWNLGETSAAPAAERSEGATLFQAKGCAACHAGPDTTSPSGSGFPSLVAAPDWASDRRTGLNAAEYLAESIVAPNASVSPEFRPGPAGPTNAMPQLRITADELDALVAYLLQR